MLIKGARISNMRHGVALLRAAVSLWRGESETCITREAGQKDRGKTRGHDA